MLNADLVRSGCSGVYFCRIFNVSKDRNLLKYWMSVTKAVFEHIQLSIKIIEMMLDELKMEVLRLCHGSTSWGIGMQIQFARSCSLFSVVLYCLSYLFPKPDILF